ncbi:MAG TPA: type II toxin-antitoxin system MqsR family toxin [Clostridiaceae bacterium]|jgi:hypothetical protein|nr:toxin-antitoxin system toxin component domain protein [Clostridium sp. CAG:452]HJJ04100.1 type II toxin-antitoxin system MqsR family toxin [Clostridiaceae bacterium]
MEINFTSPKEEVIKFLLELKKVMSNRDFDVNKDLDVILKKKNENSLDPYTTQNTLLKLDFDKNDIADTLKKLSVEEYIETGKDRKDISSPEFYIFGKEVQGNLIYIKIKIRDKINHKVFCVSFHFARYPISNFPYKY